LGIITSSTAASGLFDSINDSAWAPSEACTTS
jgi:hypothetical protein